MDPETGSVQHGGAISPPLATAINTGAAALLKDNKADLCHAVVIAQQLAADLSTYVQKTPAEPLAADLEASAQGILNYIGCAGGSGSGGIVTGAGGPSSGPGGSGAGGSGPGGVTGAGASSGPPNAAATGSGIVAGTQPPNAATSAATAAAAAAAAAAGGTGSSSGAPPNSSTIAAAGPKKKGWGWPFSSSGSPAAPPAAAAATTPLAVGPQAPPPAAAARSWIPSFFRRTPKADQPPTLANAYSTQPASSASATAAATAAVQPNTDDNPFGPQQAASSTLPAISAPTPTPALPPAAQPPKRSLAGRAYNFLMGTPEQQLQKAIAAANLDTEIEGPGEVTEETGTRTQLEAARQQVRRARNARKASNAPATAALLKSVKNFKKDKNAYTAAVARKRKTQKRVSPISGPPQGPGTNASFSMANPMLPSAAAAPPSASMANPLRSSAASAAAAGPNSNDNPFGTSPSSYAPPTSRVSPAPQSAVASLLRPPASSGNTTSFSVANPLLAASVAGPRAPQSTVASLLGSPASAAAGPASASGLTPAEAARFQQAPKQSSSWFSGFTRKNPVSSTPNARNTVNAKSKSKGWGLSSLFGKKPESTPVTLGGTLPLAQQRPPSAASTPTPTIPLLAAPVPSNPDDVPVLLERPPARSALRGNWDAMAALHQRALGDRTQLPAYTRARNAYSTAAALNTVARRNAPAETMAETMRRIGIVPVDIHGANRIGLTRLSDAAHDAIGTPEQERRIAEYHAALAAYERPAAIRPAGTQAAVAASDAESGLLSSSSTLNNTASRPSLGRRSAGTPATLAAAAAAAAASDAESGSFSSSSSSSNQPEQHTSANLNNATAGLRPGSSSLSTATSPPVNATASAAPSLSAARVAGASLAAPAAAPTAAKKPEYYSTYNRIFGTTKEKRDRLTATDNLKKYSKLPLPAGPSSSALKLTLDKFQTLVASGVDTADLSYVGAFNENMREYERVIKEEQAAAKRQAANAAKAAQAAKPVRALAPGAVLGTSLPGAGLTYSKGSVPLAAPASNPKAVDLASSPNSSGPAFAASLAAERVAANSAQAAAEGARSRALTSFKLSSPVSPLATYRAPAAKVFNRVPAPAAEVAKPASSSTQPLTAGQSRFLSPDLSSAGQTYSVTSHFANPQSKQGGKGRRTKRSKPSKARKTARR